MAKTSFLGTVKARFGFGREHASEVDRTGFGFGETLSTVALLGNGSQGARVRQAIYLKWQWMMSDPVVSGALRNHVTAALGGDENTGDLVFIEAKPDAKDSAKAKKLVDELASDLIPMINKVAHTMAYNGVGYGDAYSRLFPIKGQGVVALAVDELFLPPLVQPYEQADKTVICEVAVGDKPQKLGMDQIARLKMPRMLYVPQPLAIERSWRARVVENDPTKQPIMPSLAGGSFLADAETQYDNFVAALQGLVGQRVLDSIDESIFTAQIGGMSKEQGQEFKASVIKMLKKSKQVADDAVKSGKPYLGRIRHILPVADAKQLLQVQSVNASGGSGGGRAGNVTIDDVLLHAKLLAGALGTDITMLGFADMMSGGLGEGGFFRTSVQSAERARTIRVAVVEWINHVIDIHTAYKYGFIYPEKERPWKVTFYGTNAAMETERQRTAMDAANAALLMAQLFQQLKDAGLDEKALAHFLESVAKLDKDDAAMYAADIAKAKAKAEAEAAAGGGFGGGGGGFGGGEEPSTGFTDEPARVSEGDA